KRLRHEAQRIRLALQSLDRQTLFVLLVCVLLVLVQYAFGSRRFFRLEVAELFGAEPRGLGAWAWWFGVQGVTGFIVPVLCLLLLFRRTPREIGLGLGDWRLASGLALAYLPLVVVGTWFLSS